MFVPNFKHISLKIAIRFLLKNLYSVRCFDPMVYFNIVTMILTPWKFLFNRLSIVTYLSLEKVVPKDLNYV